MKFKLKFVDKVQTRTDHHEERYNYESEAGDFKCSFHADERPWTWVITGGNLLGTQSERLIEKFCERAMTDPNPDLNERVKELDIQL